MISSEKIALGSNGFLKKCMPVPALFLFDNKELIYTQMLPRGATIHDCTGQVPGAAQEEGA
jgi:hypothetical protein